MTCGNTKVFIVVYKNILEHFQWKETPSIAIANRGGSHLDKNK